MILTSAASIAMLGSDYIRLLQYEENEAREKNEIALATSELVAAIQIK